MVDRLEPAGPAGHRRPPRFAGWVVAGGVMVVLGVYASRGIAVTNDFRDGQRAIDSRSMIGNVDCLADALERVVPEAGTKVYLDPKMSELSGGALYQRLAELSFPRLVDVPTRADAQYEIVASVVPSPVSCEGIAVDALRLR
jgi:hypothetical protein